MIGESYDYMLGQDGNANTPSPQKKPKIEDDNQSSASSAELQLNKSLNRNLKRKAMRNQAETTRAGGNRTADRQKKPTKFNFLFEDIKEEEEKLSDKGNRLNQSDEINVDFGNININ